MDGSTEFLRKEFCRWIEGSAEFLWQRLKEPKAGFEETKMMMNVENGRKAV